MFFGSASKVSAQQITHRLFYTPNGQLMVSVLLGFGLAIMFQRTCKGAACVVLRAPASREMDGKTFRNGAGDECYRYVPRAVPCGAAPAGASKTAE
jgi:hypothetical protein